MTDDLLAEIMRDAPARTSVARPAAPVPTGPGLSFATQKHVLQALAEKAFTVIPTRDSVPVLKNFMFVVTQDSLLIASSDQESSMVCSTNMITTNRVGSAVFPAKRMMELLRAAEEAPAQVKVLGAKAHITIGQASWRLQLQSGYDYPSMPDLEEVTWWSLDREALLRTLGAVRYAVSKNSERIALTMVDVSGDRLTACDGVRFQQAGLGVDFPLSIQIPVRAADDLVKLLKGFDRESILVAELPHHLAFRLGTNTFIVSKLAAQFPDMENVLLRPALENRLRLEVDKEGLIEAIKRVRVSADLETSAVQLRLAGDSLTVVSADKVGNTAEETLDASWTHEERELTVHHGFLLEMLRSQPGERCVVLLGRDTATRKSPLLIRDEEHDMTGVLQQMMLNSWKTS